MSHKDFCFLGLVALTAVFFDAMSVGRPRVEEGRGRRRVHAGGGAGAAALGGRADPGCPRDRAHRARGRADGAVWCLHCDEAFYPRVAEWESALGALAV